MSRKGSGKYPVVLAVLLGQLITPLDVGLNNTSLPKIGQSLNLGVAASGWIMGVFWLFATVFMIIAGRTGDVLGRRKIFSYGIFVFIVGSLASGFSPNYPVLLAARAVQGLGAALTSSNALALICCSFSEEQRGKALGLLAACISLGFTIGPLLGGFICSSLGWRYIFFVNIPLGLVALILCLRFVEESETEPDQSIDLLGALILLTILAPASLSLIQVSSWGWLSPYTISLFLLALVAGWVFVMHERAAAQPVIDLGLLRIPAFSLSNMATYALFISSRLALFIAPFYLQYYRDMPVYLIGLVISLTNVIPLVLLIPSGIISDRVGTTGLELFGMSSIALSLGLPLVAGSQLTMPLLIISLLLIGLGYGVFYSPNLRAVMGSVPQSGLGFAGGVTATMRNFGFLTSIGFLSYWKAFPLNTT